MVETDGSCTKTYHQPYKRLNCETYLFYPIGSLVTLLYTNPVLIVSDKQFIFILAYKNIVLTYHNTENSFSKKGHDFLRKT